MLKYRYARGADNKSYDILALDDVTRRTGAPYSCLGCSKELIPNLPKTNRTKYYSHKVQENCSKETYLHRLAKLTFFESYTEALALGQPFLFSYRREFHCTAYKATFSHSCNGTEFSAFDLTATYKRIALEERIGDFIPDVTLLSDKTPPLFIEMAVTHESSWQKASSGAKIIEISITSEEDIQAFREKHLHSSALNIRTYGIKGKPRTGNICNGDCSHEAEFFVVYRSGKARIVSSTPAHLYQKRAIYKIVASSVASEESSSDGYQRLVANLRHHLLNGVPIKNCLLCKHQSMGQISGIWCRSKAEKISSSDAISCASYEPFTTLAEAKDAEDRNLKEHITYSERLVQRMIGSY